ncbi:hypothetical protein VTN02DRAFT_884 [Thermoascus thermophilus]
MHRIIRPPRVRARVWIYRCSTFLKQVQPLLTPCCKTRIPSRERIRTGCAALNSRPASLFALGFFFFNFPIRFYPSSPFLQDCDLSVSAVATPLFLPLACWIILQNTNWPGPHTPLIPFHFLICSRQSQSQSQDEPQCHL